MRILVTGATGLVGQGVLRECLQATDVAHVGALVRRGGLPTHPKLEEIVAPDFADLRAVEARLHPFDACLYCAGMLPPGLSEPAYRRVTLDLTLQVAQALARLNPALTFLYVSGAMSDPGSHLMPLRVKGDTERSLAALPIRTVMFRPGAVQPVEGVHSPHPARDALYRLASPALGLGVKLAPQLMTTTERMGRAMLAVLRQADPPAVVENAEINRLGA
ncbi:MAG TPA: NAD-dependent epimerase/dehydratase family protein [Luteimonas sp.]|nr:NAD-dependent epimerase/dehydratase family protein [Luteimonas sp.]